MAEPRPHWPDNENPDQPEHASAEDREQGGLQRMTETAHRCRRDLIARSNPLKKKHREHARLGIMDNAAVGCKEGEYRVAEGEERHIGNKTGYSTTGKTDPENPLAKDQTSCTIILTDECHTDTTEGEKKKITVRVEVLGNGRACNGRGAKGVDG